MWRSDTGAGLDELIKGWEIDASLFNEVSCITYQYKVGRGDDGSAVDEEWADPADLDTTLYDQRLIGYDQDHLYVVEAGYGPLLNTEYSKRTPNDDGIDLLLGRTFNQDTAWFITVHRIITQQVPAGSGSVNKYSDVEIVTVDRDFYVDATDNLYKKLVLINGAGSVVAINFPDLATIPDYTHVTFNTHNGSQKYLKLQFDTGDQIRFQGANKNVIYLAKNEVISLFFFEGVVYVTAYDGKAGIRGSVFSDWQDRSATGPFLLADEDTGVLSRNDYPGLYEWIESLAPGVAVTSAAAWALDKTKYYINTTTFEFRVPHLANMFRRFKEDVEVSGTFQEMMIEDHKHRIGYNDGVVGGAGGYGRDTGEAAITFGLGGSPSSANRGLTDKPARQVDANNVSLTRADGTDISGIETRPKNFKEIPMIIL